MLHTPEFFAAHTVSELWNWSDYDLEGEGRLTHPMAYDLCGRHADTLKVPNGWALADRRVRYPAALSHAIAS